MRAQFDEYAKNYDQLVDSALSSTGEGKDYFATRRVEWVSSYLERLGLQPRILLDYGCGNGSNAPLLLQQLRLDSLIGVDVSEQSIAEARRRAPLKATFSTPSSFALNQQADLAYACGVFHHIAPTERTTALNYVYRALKPGGIFTFFEHNPWNPGTRYVMSNCEFDKDAITITPAEAPTLLQSAGFQVLTREFLFFFPKWLGFLRRLEPMLKKVPIGGQYVVVGRRLR